MLKILMLLAPLSGPRSTDSASHAAFRRAWDALPLVQVAAIGHVVETRDTTVGLPFVTLSRSSDLPH
jgi:hypothetical protein